MLRVTLDTNEYVAALNGSRRALRLLHMAIDGTIEIAITEAIIVETIRVLRENCTQNSTTYRLIRFGPGRHRNTLSSDVLVPDLFVAAVPAYYDQRMLRYHVAFYLPRTPGETVVAEALDFPGAVTQGFDLQDARLMIANALEDLAQTLLEEGKPLPVPSENAHSPEADLIELIPLSVHVGIAPR